MAGAGSADRLSAASIATVGMTAWSAGVASIITESPMAVTGPLSAGAIVVVVVVVVVVDGMVAVVVVRARVVDDATRDEWSSEPQPKATRTKRATTVARLQDIRVNVSLGHAMQPVLPAPSAFLVRCRRAKHSQAQRDRRRVNATQHSYDVVIVGGGAAGLSAALVLGRARRTVAVIDAGAPRNAPAAHMQGFLSRDGMPPADFLAAGREEVAGYGVEIVDDAVVKIEPGFVVHLASGGTATARRILVTTGVTDDLPALPGVRERWGRDLLHCPYCHGWEVRNQPLGVLGTHPGAVLHAQLIRQWSDDVVFFTHTTDVNPTERAQLEARGINVVDGDIVRLVVEADRLAGVELADGRVFPRAAVFIRPRNVPHPDGLLAGLGADIDAEGFVIVDRDGRTSTPRVWAAGNVVDPRGSVIAAAGAAATAAMAINADLVQEDVAASAG